MTGRSGAALLVGLDVGGTKTAALVCERDGTVRGRHHAPSALGDPEQAIDGLASVVRAALHEACAGERDVAALGVGVPGRVDPDRGEVRLAVNLRWHGMPLGPGLESRLGIPTVLENDVRAAALGLHRRQTAGPVESLAYLAVGTGISAGVVIRGELHRGAHGLAGEIGHVPIDRSGPPCACGLRGCVEAYGSGPSIAARAEAAGFTPVPGGTRGGDHADAGGRPGPEAVFRAAAQGDPIAKRVIDDAGWSVAWAIHLLALAYDVERVVLGGGVSHAGEAFLAPIRREIERLAGASALASELLVPGLVQLLPPGAEAGAWGAVTIAGQSLGVEWVPSVPRGREVGHA